MNKVLVSAAVLLAAAQIGFSQVNCQGPALSEDRVKEIVAAARMSQKDLPAPFEEFRSTLRKDGCYYVYIEYALPESLHRLNMFKLNQDGTIVDAQPGSLKCPDKVLTEAELKEIVQRERAARKDLPPPFPQYRVRVDRQRCLYIYYEYAIPESRGNFQVFTIDPFGGGVMSVLRPDPY